MATYRKDTRDVLLKPRTRTLKKKNNLFLTCKLRVQKEIGLTLSFTNVKTGFSVCFKASVSFIINQFVIDTKINISYHLATFVFSLWLDKTNVKLCAIHKPVDDKTH